MSLLSELLSYINILDGPGWFMKILYTITMFFEGLIFHLVSYCYKLFTLMCSLNINSLYAVIAPLVDRLKAVIMVFMVFKIGMMLIGYLLNPDEAPKGGGKILINIAICGMLLISYEFIFGFFNELSMLIMGVPEGYSFTTLNQIVDVEDGEDSGLIVRYVFGDNIDIDMGDYIAYETLSMFVVDSQGESGRLVKTLKDGDGYNFIKLPDVVDYIGKTIEYTPLLPFVIGIFLIFNIVKNTIEIGIRMFKLLILQLIAPIAIISIVSKEGVKNKSMQAYIKSYIATLIDAFTRILAMLIVTVFVSKFFMNINEFLGTSSEESFFTKVLILCLVIVAGYTFAGKIPQFINDSLATHFQFGEGKGAMGTLGKFLGGAGGIVAGGLTGGLTGLITGAASGASSKAGFTGTLDNAISGLVGGVAGGVKGKSISDKVKNISGNNNKTANRAIDIAKIRQDKIDEAQKNGNKKWYTGAFSGASRLNQNVARGVGGFVGYNTMHDHNIDEQIKSSDKAYEANSRNYEDIINNAQNENAEMDRIEQNILSAMENEQSSFNYSDGGGAINWGSSEDRFASTVADNDSNVQKYMREVDACDAALSKADAKDIDYWVARKQGAESDLADERRRAESNARTEYRSHMDHHSASNGTTIASRKTTRTNNNKAIEKANKDRVDAGRTHADNNKALEKQKYGKK